MAKKEVKTDLWVYELLQEANIHLTPQGCDIKEIDEALRTACRLSRILWGGQRLYTCH